MWASVCLSILPQNCVQWLELTWAPSHNDWIPYLWPELTWKTLCWSIPQRPGGDPGSSDTDPSAGGSDSDHPPNIHSLQRREQTHRCVAWSHFTYSYRLRWECFVLACVVLDKSYYRETLAGCAPPPSKSASCLRSARAVCWSYWNRSTCTSSPAIKQGLLCDGSESNILPAVWSFCACV